MKRLILIRAIAAAPALHAQRAAPASGASQADEYTRYELLAPDPASFKVAFEVSVTSAGAREYVDRIRSGTEVASVSAVDLMTGATLDVRKTPGAMTVTLARPVPPDGQGRVRIEKTVKDVKVDFHERTARPHRRLHQGPSPPGLLTVPVP